MHFFIDQNKLTTQDPGDAYGPKTSCESTHYRVTSRFQLTDKAKAYACCTGQIVVLPSALGTDYVNIILKPELDSSNVLEVDYFIYRGITKLSLIDSSSNIIATSATNYDKCDITDRFWTDPSTDTTATNFGYTTSSAHDSKNIEEIFNGNITNLTPFCVFEGESIGNFTNTSGKKIGFEVVMDKGRFPVTISHVKAEEGEINVSGLSGLTEKMEREKILCFMDPAAFYGYHSRSGKKYIPAIKYKTISGSTVTSHSTTNVRGHAKSVYSKLISNFHTKNRVYLDIRNEDGYSLQAHGSTISNTGFRIGATGGTLQPEQGFRTNSWPIIFGMATQSVPTKGRRRFVFKLKVNNTNTNTNHILSFSQRYAHNPVSTPPTKNSYTGTDLVSNTAGDQWSNNLSFEAITHTTGNVVVATYVKLSYVKRELDHVPFKSVFPSIDINELGKDYLTDKHLVDSKDKHIGKPMDDYRGFGNFEYLASNGAYWDNSNVIFYSKIREKAQLDSEKYFTKTFDDKLSCNIPSFTSSALYQKLKTICRPYIWATSPAQTINIPGINYYDTSTSGISNCKENLMMLGLTKAQLDAVKADTQLGNTYKRFIVLEPYNTGTTAQDVNPSNTTPVTYTTTPASNGRHVDGSSQHLPHFIYTLRLRGYAAGATSATTVTPLISGNPILLHSRDNLFFSSQAFCNNETVSNFPGEPNRVEFHVFNDGKVRINDNIDYSIVNSYYERIPLNPTTTATTNRRQISYLFHNTSFDIWSGHQQNTTCYPDAPTFIRSFDMVMANKMRRHGLDRNNSSFPNASDVTLFRNYQDEGISGVDAGESYHHNTTKDIYTKVRTTPASSFSGHRYYKNQKFEPKNTKEKAKCFLIKFISGLTRNPSNNHITNIELQHTSPSIDLTYHNTLRLYPNPEVAAASLGALIDSNKTIVCQGYAYEDASCYPSAEHVNGSASDTDYFATTADNVAFVTSLHKFGFKLFRVGLDAKHRNLKNHTSFNNLDITFVPDKKKSGWTEGTWTLHQGHLHSTSVKLN